MGYINQKQLESICREGRFQKEPTVAATTWRYNDASGAVTVVLVNPQKAERLGTCLANDIPKAIDAMLMEYDSERVNPNLSALKCAYNEAKIFDVGPSLRTERKHEVRKTLTLIIGEPT